MLEELGARVRMIPRELILSLTDSSCVEVGETVQSLWSGYGEIVRVVLDSGPAIVKHVDPPSAAAHPRGWATDRSHSRKLRSYAVESAWYRDWSARCGEGCRVPRCLGTAELETGGWLFVLEDLDASGFPRRHQRLHPSGIELCLRWLAEFHATFLFTEPKGLWEVGTYWHLATRPDELAAMADVPLKEAAGAIDERLSAGRYQTFVHGDAKVANFCFASDHSRVAAVDFQYVGGGCGMKDVAYFLGSCLDGRGCERHANDFVDRYFEALHVSLGRHRPDVDFDDLETEWRELFPFAWADFDRFLIGWSPGHAKMNRYSHRLSLDVLAALKRR